MASIFLSIKIVAAASSAANPNPGNAVILKKSEWIIDFSIGICLDGSARVVSARYGSRKLLPLITGSSM
ncbi:hypothetical protein QVH35_01355 [Candidatus Nitrosotenuis chungbukensis]|nr:hypothetical protein [Candidatus Nitrosotenuis chungbukensis]WKT58184.1 hypothetical protein QVH35_01355 [Candidatus Nitrosotenuis chungbukensis]